MATDYDDVPSWHVLSRAGIEFVGESSNDLQTYRARLHSRGLNLLFHCSVTRVERCVHVVKIRSHHLVFALSWYSLKIRICYYEAKSCGAL